MKPAGVFGDHMVLQRDKLVPIWGRARPGREVTVRVGRQSRTARAAADGRWQVRLAPMPATTVPQTITITGENTVTIRDVLVGEVWVAAGQSNMEWPLGRAASAKQALAQADRPRIRLLHLVGAARGGAGKYTSQHLARLTAEKFFSGTWRPCTPETAKPFSAVAYFFGVKLREELDVPIGLIDVAIGGTPAEAWVRREALAEHPKLKALVTGNWLDNAATGQWCRQRAKYNLSRAMKAGERIPGDDLGPNHSFKPTFCWSAGVRPLVPMAVRGAIWYQGESNAESPARVRQHDLIFPLLVRDWRTQWGQGDLPFLYVQLPAMGRPDWPQFREGQRRMLSQLPNVGMAVTIDVGHPRNVHPTKKRPVGERLALWALAKTYARKVVHSGPLCRSMKRQGPALVLHFDHVAGGLAAAGGGKLAGFELAGPDGRYQPAEAKIVGETVVVTAAKVASPVSVRYAWAPVPTCNLIDKAPLPASPFQCTLEP